MNAYFLRLILSLLFLGFTMFAGVMGGISLRMSHPHEVTVCTFNKHSEVMVFAYVPEEGERCVTKQKAADSGMTPMLIIEGLIFTIFGFSAWTIYRNNPEPEELQGI